jgi:hypothetical protein
VKKDIEKLLTKARRLGLIDDLGLARGKSRLRAAEDQELGVFRTELRHCVAARQPFRIRPS